MLLLPPLIGTEYSKPSEFSPYTPSVFNFFETKTPDKIDFLNENNSKFINSYKLIFQKISEKNIKVVCFDMDKTLTTQHAAGNINEENKNSYVTNSAKLQWLFERLYSIHVKIVIVTNCYYQESIHIVSNIILPNKNIPFIINNDLNQKNKALKLVKRKFSIENNSEILLIDDNSNNIFFADQAGFSTILAHIDLNSEYWDK